MMTHPQIDQAWEHAPEFTRDVLKTISDQAFFVEFKSILIENDPKCFKNNQRKRIFFAKILLSQNCP